LELKTGKTDSDQVSHRGQLMLYIAMLSEVEQQKIDYGLLIYLKYDNNNTLLLVS
jgi:hypothetical protein